MRFHIGKQRVSEMPLQLEQIETPPGAQLPHIAIRAFRAKPEDPAPLAAAVAFPLLTVDSVPRKLEMMTWVGGDGPLQVGGHYTRILELSEYRPRIDVRAQHLIEAKVGEQTAKLTAATGETVGTEWDKATATIGPAPALPVVLEGVVTGSDGRPASGYEVHVAGAAIRFTEHTDRAGRYVFRNVAAGKYEVLATPPTLGQPALTVPDVDLDPRQRVHLDLDLGRRFSIAGRVTYPGGAPAKGWDVMSVWPAPDGKSEYHDSATTGDDGRYTLGAPFETASFVGWGGEQVQHGVKAGRQDVNFVAPAKPASGQDGGH